jgi:hypothetical protein
MEENKQATGSDQVPAPTPTPASAPAPSPTPDPNAPTPALPNQPLSPAAPVVTKGKNKNLLIAIIAGAVLLVGGVAYGVYAYVTNTPDYMLQRATEQFGREANNAMAAKFKIVGGNDVASMTFNGDIAVRGDAANKNGEVVMGVGSGDSRITVSARSIDESLFLKAGSLANLPNLLKSFSPEGAAVYDTPDMKAALARIDGKWFSITKEDLQGMGAESNDSTSQPTPEELQKVLDIYRKHKVFQADKVYADEQVEGVASGHFTVKISKTELTAFLTEVKNANLKSIKVTDENINEAGKAADEFAKQGTLDVWITRDTKKFKQIRFASTEKGSEGTFTFTFVTELPQFDKLEKPADARPFSELLTTFLGPTTFDLNAASELDQESLLQ